MVASKVTRTYLGSAALFLFAALFAADAVAQVAPDLTDPNQSFSGLLELLENQSALWGPKLRGYAFTLFWGLASIQFTWSLGQLVFKSADLSEVMGELVRQVMTIGFWLAFLMFSVEWCTAIVNSFREAAGAATGLGSALRPGDLFSLGVELATVMGRSGLVSPATQFAIALCALLVLLCFVFIAALMAVALVESYIVINAGVLFMGFAGASWTRDTTMSFVKYAISVGAKLFILTLLVGLVISSGRAWAIAYDHNDASMWTLVGLSLVCAYLCKSIPDLIQGLISGASIGGGGAMGGIAAAGAAFAMAATAAAKTVVTGGAAAPLAAGAAANAVNAGGAAAGMGAGAGFGAGAGGAGAGVGAAGTSASSASAGLGGRFGSEGAKGAAQGAQSSSPPAAPNASSLGAKSEPPGAAGTPGSSSSSGDAAANSTPASTSGEAKDEATGADGGSTQSNGMHRALESLAHGGKAAYALAAMTTPGVDASPDAAALIGGPGEPEPLSDPDTAEHVPSESSANVIRPQAQGTTSSPVGDSTRPAPQAKATPPPDA